MEEENKVEEEGKEGLRQGAEGKKGRKKKIN